MKNKIYSLLSVLAITLIFVSNITVAGGPEYNPSYWSFYFGGFVGYYSADFGYGADYLSTNPGRQIYNDTAYQQGVSGGGQLGFQYHFQSPYFLGLNASAASNANRARLAVVALTPPDPILLTINNQLHINVNADIAGIFGADITPQTHVYAKIGASYARLTQSITGFGILSVPFPSASFARQQRKNLWGWVVGVGITRDLSRWFNIFVQYDRYDYGSYELNSYSSLLPFAANDDSLTQHARITASAVHLGLNFKSMSSFVPIRRILIANPWLIYIGAFLGYYSNDFQYGGLYSSSVILGSDQLYNNTIYQQGFSGGGQVGVQYHFQSPYSIGLSFSASTNANKARLTVTAVPSPTGGGGDISNLNHQFRVASNADIAGIFGADITARTHLYAKIGASCGDLIHNLTGTVTTAVANPLILFAQNSNKSIWGWIVGLGLTQDLSRWLNAFVEYDRYDYGSHELNDYNAVFGAGSIDQLTQHARVTASAVRLGLNLKFIGSFAPMPRVFITHPWLIYFGGFAAYYSAAYQYGGIYFQSAPSNQLHNNTVFQQGVSGGGQLGFQYHLQSPYFLGLNFSAASNANRGRLTESDSTLIGGVGRDTSHQFQIHTNVDMAAVVGADITAQTHIYAKFGASYAHLTQTISGTVVNAPIANVVFTRFQRKSLWGFMMGAGLTQDLCHWLSAFIEYDRYDYGTNNLNNYNLLFPAVVDRLTQHVRVLSYAAKLGFNVKFEL